jgi:hypothetical protein
MFESCARGVSSTNLSAIYVVEPKMTQTLKYLYLLYMFKRKQG